MLALLDGAQELDGPMSEHFPAVPAEALEAFRDEAPGIYGERGGWHIHIRAWLVRHPGGLVLIDTGVGQAGGPGADGWFGVAGRLPLALADAGTASESIDTVVLTHVHDDHLGGTVTFSEAGPAPAFPRATYLLQRADREWQAELAREDEEDRAIDDLLIRPLERSGQLVLLDGDHALADGIDLQLAPGHTPGHQIVRLRSDGAGAIISADAFNHPIQIPHPDWPSRSDAEPDRAATSRRAVLADLGSHPGTTLAPTHFAEPFGEVRAGHDGLAAWRPR